MQTVGNYVAANSKCYAVVDEYQWGYEKREKLFEIIEHSY